MNRYTLSIEGMMCGMCESHISQTLRKQFPEAKVNASHRKGLATVETDQTISSASFHQAIDPTGYRLKKIDCEPAKKSRLKWFGSRS